ncbi:hypothetical protein BDQ17DRAFT_447778 [Cyathus striatus]|nr:hypothetical protein BDQ17DRAFT_447778 [Cyathus striatus]
MLLNEIQRDFEPSKKITFQDTSHRNFPGLTSYFDTTPDIVSTYLGQTASLQSDLTWSQCCITLEVNTGRDTVDISAKEVRGSPQDEMSISRLLEDGRNLLSASSSCYVFAIGVYLETHEVRIYRFDWSGCISWAFNYTQKPHMIRYFLWQLINPFYKIPNTVVGWDEMIRIPTQDEVNEMQTKIDRLCPGFQADRCLSRWVKVRLNLAAFKSQIINTDLPSRTDKTSCCKSSSGNCNASLAVCIAQTQYLSDGAKSILTPL